MILFHYLIFHSQFGPQFNEESAGDISQY